MLALKPERNTEHLNFVATPSLKKQIEAFAAKNGVSRGAAIRYALEIFLNSDLHKMQGELVNKEGEYA